MLKRVLVGLFVTSTAVVQAQPGTEPAPGIPAGAPMPPPDGSQPPPPEAMAQPIPQPMPVVQPMPPVAPPEEYPGVDKGVLEDANAGRGWISPTALSEPKGTWSFSDFELLVISAGYAFTNEFSMSATTLLPLFEDQPFFGVLNAKYQFLKSGRLRMAAQAAVFYGGDGDSGVTVADVGGVATLCLDDDCHSHIGGFLAAGFANEDQSAVPFLLSATAVGRLGKHVKAVVEVDSGFIAGDTNPNSDDTSDGFLLWYGIRFTSRQIGVDLGFAKPFIGDTDDPLVLGLPFVSFTYRGI